MAVGVEGGRALGAEGEEQLGVALDGIVCAGARDRGQDGSLIEAGGARDVDGGGNVCLPVGIVPVECLGRLRMGVAQCDLHRAVARRLLRYCRDRIDDDAPAHLGQPIGLGAEALAMSAIGVVEDRDRAVRGVRVWAFRNRRRAGIGERLDGLGGDVGCVLGLECGDLGVVEARPVAAERGQDRDRGVLAVEFRRGVDGLDNGVADRLAADLAAGAEGRGVVGQKGVGRDAADGTGDVAHAVVGVALGHQGAQLFAVARKIGGVHIVLRHRADRRERAGSGHQAGQRQEGRSGHDAHRWRSLLGSVCRRIWDHVALRGNAARRTAKRAARRQRPVARAMSR